MSVLRSRVFNNGNSQAVRIPAELRLDTDLVQISRNEQGDLIIHPLREARGKALLQALEGFDEDFIAALEADRETPIPMQDREDL
ncbi:MAG: AbrB/MazE/SpoVT family DNA-binding domain-containing protein [Wenzhouxiangellaceae bacterium]|nr:AbrB/MazE/SpoVT family DNA-binding domain-containing protein [Wenzhouxiangellaceae bacterium]